jgi:hypothetical protein
MEEAKQEDVKKQETIEPEAAAESSQVQEQPRAEKF